MTGSHIGRATPHESAQQHVTGRAQYVDDIPAPRDTLHVATGYADNSHADIAHLDLSAVRTLTGVVDVITAADVPGGIDIGPVFPGDFLFADNRIEYAGQPLFAVAATSLRIAQQAVRLAKFELTEREALLDVDAALAAEAFVLPSKTWTSGEPKIAVESAELRLQTNLYVRGQEHFYLEGQVALAIPEDHGGIIVHASTQHPDDVQKLVARVLGLGMHKVKVISRRMGGAFGGKESQAAPLACIAAVFAARLNRAVKYRMPRHDDMIQTGKRHDFACSYDIGYNAQGIIEGAVIELSAKCGYSPDLSDGIVDRAMFHACNAYYLPQAQITGHRCKTNTVSNTAFRGFGGPQGMIAIEAAMDEIAQQIGLDPLDVRKRNLYSKGRDITPYAQQLAQFELAEIIEELEASSDYRARRVATNEFNQANSVLKKGLALTPVQFGISFTTTHLNQAGALLNIYRDGSIDINHAGTEMGQGLHTKIRQVVAEAFGVPLQRVSHNPTQTDKVPNSSPTAASSGSDLNGMAALAACNTLKTRLTEFLQQSLGWPTGKPAYARGLVRCEGRELTFDELVAQAYMGRISLSATGFYSTPQIHFDKTSGKGHPFYYFACGAAVSEVIIDTLTGEYRVLRTDILHDAGDSLNPAIDLGQIEGGFVQGMGWLTTEELLWDADGRVISNSPANYKIPTAHDCPEIFNVDFFKRANPIETIHRSKAVGEPPLMLAISVWCALRDACAAAGDHQTLPTLAVPATPEAVYWAVQQARR